MEEENELVEIDGKLARQTEEGNFRDVKTGRYLTGPANPNFSDPDYARAAIQKRWEEVYKARQEGIRQAVEEDTGLENIDLNTADTYIHKTLTREVVLSAEVPARDRVMGYKALFSGSGMTENPKKVTTDITGTVAFVTVEELAAKYFHEYYQGDPEKVMQALQQFRENQWTPD